MRGKIVGVCLAGLALCGCGQDAAVARAEKALQGKQLTFEADIKPIVAARCQKCHVDEAKGKYSMGTLENALKGGKWGSDIVPGDAEKSRLYLLVADKDKSHKIMPPKGDRLTPEQIATIKVWINGGAK